MADIGVGHRHTESDVTAASPPPRAHEQEAALRQRFVDRADGAGNAQHLLPRLEFLVVARVDQDHIFDVVRLAHLDVPVGGEDLMLFADIGWHLDPLRQRAPAEGAALEHVKGLAIVRELDVDRLAEALLEEVKHGFELAREGRFQQTVKGYDEFVGIELSEDPDYRQDLVVPVD